MEADQPYDGPTFAVSCSNIPVSLFDDDNAIEHFSKFGFVVKIVLQPKKQSCIIEYGTRQDADKAILNAGAYDGFMFDVKFVKKKRPKPNDDPEWLPDPDVAAELASMGRSQLQMPRPHRQQKMDLEAISPILIPKKVPVKRIGIKKVAPGTERKKTKSISKSVSPVKVTLNKDELLLLINRAWITIDEKLKALEIRNKLLRGCVKTRHAALKGSCPDMCPEKERLLRQFQRQVAVYELSSDESTTNKLDPMRAVKEYSRSSADQEEPLPHELRPVPVLHKTLLYLLHHIIDLCEDPEESLSDWFHFMWDRLRAIRKDIAQQALCCKGALSLVEACARFHAHCAARLVEEPSSSFDQRLNTENLLKCLQTLKYMYNDLRDKGEADACIYEPEFRAYVILLNLHDANFMWEVQHLERGVQSSPEVSFAIKVFTALDNNNYVKFFKLVSSTTYLNACILLRYFNDVRVRALRIMIKAFSPRGVSYFPAEQLLEMLGFESMGSMEYFLNHYGIQINYNDQNIPIVAMDKNTFINNTELCVQERAEKFVEAKRKCSLGEMVYGKPLPEFNFETYHPHSSFDNNHYFKRNAILAEDQGNIPPPELAMKVKKILENTNNIKSSEPLPISTSTNALNGDKKFTFVFAEPEKVNEVDLPVLKTFVPPAPGNEPNNSVFGNNIFKSNLAENPGSAVFSKIPTVFESSSSNFMFSKPGLINIQNNIPPNITPANNNIFGNFSSNVGPQTHLFGPKIDNTNAFPLSNKTTPTVFENQSKNIFSMAVKSNENFFAKNVNNESKNIFGSQNENSFFSLHNREKVLEEEKLKLAEAEKQKLAELEKLKKAEAERQRIIEAEKQRIAREKILQEEKERLEKEIKRKMEEEKAKLAYEEELKRKEIEKREYEEFTERFSQSFLNEIIEELSAESSRNLMEEEMQRLEDINIAARNILNDLCNEIYNEECKRNISIELRLNEIRSRLLARSVVKHWRALVARSQKRRFLLNNTPAWIQSQPPEPTPNQSEILKRMRDFHNGTYNPLKVPVMPPIVKINVFDVVKKYLLQQSQETKQTFNIHWKVVIALPQSEKFSEQSDFYQTWIRNTFISEDQQSNEDHILHLSENYWLKRFSISICKISGLVQQNSKNTMKAITGMNGLLFYSDADFNNIKTFEERFENILRVKNSLNCLPVALILTTDKMEIIEYLKKYFMQYKHRGSISMFKIYTTDGNDNSLLTHTKAALKWLALHSPCKPPLEVDKLFSYLHYCIGNELWYRFKLALRSPIRSAFENVETIINIYNEAVDRTVQIACNNNLKNHPSFAEELQQFVPKTALYPKSYEYFPHNWKSNVETLKDLIKSFKIQQYRDKWPPSSWSMFQTSIKNYIRQLNCYKDPDSVFLKVVAKFLDVDAVEDLEPQCQNFCWLDVTEVLINEKISQIQKYNYEVVYNEAELENYRTTPWWYKSAFTKNVAPFIEELDVDFLENTLEDLGINSSKKLKLDASLENIPDDEWLSSTLDQLDNSVKEASYHKRMFEELELSIEEGRKKQEEIEALLKSALN